MAILLLGAAAAVAVVVVVVGTIYKLGLLDRPAFQVDELIQLYLLVATTTKKDIGGNVQRLLTSTRNAIESVDRTKPMLEQAAILYGAPKGATAISVGLFLDDPSKVQHPRWAIGWALQVTNVQELQDIHKQVQEKMVGLEKEESFRAVTIGGGKVIKGCIPWRNMITPMIGAMLHWHRAMDVYKKSGFTSNSGRSDDEGAIACEVYVTGPNCSMVSIDYIVLMGDTKDIYDCTFPLTK